MSTENFVQQQEQQLDQAKESQQTEIESSPQPEPRISEDIKKLLNSLIKKNLEKRIIRLELRNEEQNKNIKIIKTNFKNFEFQIHSLIKNVEETKKRKEKEAEKKKVASPRKGRIVGSKHSLTSKSVPPGKKLKLGIKTDYNTSKMDDRKKLNINTSNFKTEVNSDKDYHNRAKSFKEKRIFSERNINKGKMKLIKKTDNTLSPYRKDDKKEDIKGKTMSFYHTEKKEDSKRNFNNLTLNKSKTREKEKINKKEELAKTFSETDIKDK